MIGAIAFCVALVAFILFACWLGGGGETSGKAGDSTGTGSIGGGDGG